MEHFQSLTGNEFKIWYYITELCSASGGVVSLSYSTLTSRCGVKRELLSKSLNRLVELRLITKETHKISGNCKSTCIYTSIASYTGSKNELPYSENRTTTGSEIELPYYKKCSTTGSKNELPYSENRTTTGSEIELILEKKLEKNKEKLIKEKFEFEGVEVAGGTPKTESSGLPTKEVWWNEWNYFIGELQRKTFKECEVTPKQILDLHLGEVSHYYHGHTIEDVKQKLTMQYNEATTGLPF